MKTPNTPKRHKAKIWYYVISLVLLFTLIFWLFPSNGGKILEKNTSQQPTVEEILPSAKEVEEVVPDEETEFFSKEGGKALLFYAMVNDSVVFYKTKGIDPLTGDSLMPVTKAIIEKYKSSLPVKKEIAKTKDSRTYKVNEVKIYKKKEKPVVKKKKIIRESIWNTSVANRVDRDEVSLFVFDEKDQIDISLTKHLKNEFTKRKYFITDEIIYTDQMTSEIATHLKSSNIEYFKGNLKEFTDYLCIGSVSYTYKPNAYRNDQLDCMMKIVYFIYASDTAEKLFSEEDTVVGSGQTKETARLSAIQKFVL